jgi:catecholate siderophore receptor
MMSPRYGVLGSVSRAALMAGVAFGVSMACADADAQQVQGEQPAQVAADGRSANAAANAAPHKSGPARLSPIAVEGEAGGGTAEGYKADYSASQKFTAPLVDTPKSVTVIPQQVIQDTGSLTLTDALRTTPGITLGSGEGGNPIGDRPFIRGFDSTSGMFVDGVRDPSSQSREIFNIEQVEIAKGPSSAFVGRGASGGAINIITKKPVAQTFFNASTMFGTDLTKRGTVDANYRVNDTIALRFNLMGQKGNVAGRDALFNKRWGVAPSVTFGMGTSTRATLTYYHLETNNMPDYGLPFRFPTGKPVNVDPDNFYGLKNRDFQKTNINVGTAILEHDFTDHLMLRNTSRFTKSKNNYIVTNPDDNKGNVPNDLVYRSVKSRDSSTNSLVNQTDLSGDFNVLGFKNTFATGGEVGREKTDSRSWNVVTGATDCPLGDGPAGGYNCTGLHDPDPNDPWVGNITKNAPTHTTTKYWALYGFDTIEFNEQWSLNLGIRYDHFNTRANPPTGEDIKNTSNFVSYQAGLVYKPARNGSVYFAFGTSANPSGVTSGEGAENINLNIEDLKPERVRNYELGTKWDLLHNNMSVTAAIFHTVKTNARVQGPDPAVAIQEAIGEYRINGAELGVAGRITEKWNVFGGYTFLGSKTLDPGPRAANQNQKGKDFPNTPRHSFSMFSTYRVLPQLTVGGGAFYSSMRYANPANTKYVSSYWRFDAMAVYQLNPRFDIRLNVQNIFDKRYYTQMHPVHFAVPAAGRVALISLDAHF